LRTIGCSKGENNMSKLVVRALRCVEETDEVGNDDVYMVIFRGSFSLPPDVKVVGGKDTVWGDMYTSKLVVHDVVLDDPYHAENVYVAALFEQDWNKDILTGGTWGKVAELWAQNWLKFPGPKGSEQCALAALVWGGAIDNDEFLGVRRILPILKDGGKGTLVIFEGDGGKYRVRFVKRP
jgi:hypothetical protein